MVKILIALDFNPTAQKVAEIGHAMGGAMGAKVVLLHVVADAQQYYFPEYSPIMGFTGFNNITSTSLIEVDSYKKESMEYLETSRRHLKDENIELMVEEGDTADTILQVAADIHADLIVMGSHSRKWLDKVLMGSNAEKVLDRSSIPLLIIPTKEDKSEKE